MANSLKIKVNGLTHGVSASLDTPLLYVLHNELHLHGPRFGCGLAQCGACSVLLDGKEIRSCVTPGRGGQREEHHDARGPSGPVGEAARNGGGGAGVASAPAGVDRRSGAALRLLPERHDDPGRRSARDDEEPVRGPDPHGDERASLPLWDLSENPDRDPAGGQGHGKGRCVDDRSSRREAASRARSFVKGGAIVVSLVVGGSALAGKAGAVGRSVPRSRRNPRPEPVRVVRPVRPDLDRLVVRRASRQLDLGQARPGRSRPGLADRVRDDRGRGAEPRLQPDAADPERHRRHAESGLDRRAARRSRPPANRCGRPPPRRIRRSSAWPRRSSACRSRTSPSRRASSRAAGRRSPTPQLVGGKLFNVKAPAAYGLTATTANPPAAGAGLAPGFPGLTKPVSQYTIIGVAPGPPRLDIPAKVTGTYTYVHNIRVPGMLHGRIVRPRGQGAYGDGTNPKVRVDRPDLDQPHSRARRSCRRGTSSGSSPRTSTTRSRPRHS